MSKTQAGLVSLLLPFLSREFVEEFIAGQEELVGRLWSDQVAYVASQLNSSTAHVLYSPASKYVLFFVSYLIM